MAIGTSPIQQSQLYSSSIVSCALKGEFKNESESRNNVIKIINKMTYDLKAYVHSIMNMQYTPHKHALSKSSYCGLSSGKIS